MVRTNTESGKESTEISAVQNILKHLASMASDTSDTIRNKTCQHPNTNKERAYSHSIHSNTKDAKLELPLTNTAPKHGNTSNLGLKITILGQERAQGPSRAHSTLSNIATNDGNLVTDKKCACSLLNKKQIGLHTVHSDTEADKREPPIQSLNKQSGNNL